MADSRRMPSSAKAEAAGETREALLEAGAALLREQPVGAVLTQVKAQPVAQRAGRTIGAFYHHWSSQEAYHRDLLAYVLDPQRLTSTAAAAETVLADLPRGLPLEEVVRRAAGRNFDMVRADPYVPLILALWGKQAQDEQVRELLRAHYRSVTDRLVPVYRAFFAAYGLTLRPPYTVEVFAATLTALVEGLAVRAAVDPEAVPLDLPHPGGPSAVPADGGRWDLFSATVVGIVRAMTAPAGAA
ncbi:TetR/AcrR family transcriptional regulator [Geodermatophilus chilensis]|uniref:TetR/AcrR family transcriptional regulator n=1 Tax=Geodermatophilus chilensis TaxID=2035835 RepID=UPI000C26931C|nr:TetR/AcrR family transcriptional regulator [Geodermatophilus chilensis]